jgi:predicted Zn-dependent protease
VSARLEALRAMLEDDPADPFTRYAVAMELRALDRLDEALDELAGLAKDAPDYVATYYQYARALQAKGRTDDAVAAARRGVEVAGAAGDDHTKDELEELIAELQA